MMSTRYSESCSFMLSSPVPASLEVPRFRALVVMINDRPTHYIYSQSGPSRGLFAAHSYLYVGVQTDLHQHLTPHVQVLTQMATHGTAYGLIFVGILLVALHLGVEADGKPTVKFLASHQHSTKIPPWLLLGRLLRAGMKAEPCAPPPPTPLATGLCLWVRSSFAVVPNESRACVFAGRGTARRVPQRRRHVLSLISPFSWSSFQPDHVRADCPTWRSSL